MELNKNFFLLMHQTMCKIGGVRVRMFREKRSVGRAVPAESFEDFNLTIGNPADHEHK